MRETPSTIARLADLLSREEVQCQLLETTIREEREAIRRLAIDRFAGINDTRTAVLRTIRSLEEERVAVMDRLAEEWRLDRKTMSLPLVCARLNSAEAQGLDRSAERVASKIRRLRDEIAVNAMMIAQFQQVLQGALHVCGHLWSGNDLYSAQGQARAVSAMVVTQRG
jgi:flagellar biosynthesis/type III secretory pathway chaperone